MKVDLRELATRESERVEWKANVADISDIVKTAVSFANDFSNLGGGYIVCGAQEIKDAHGFQSVKFSGLESDRLKQIEGQFLQHCREKVDPSIVPLTDEIIGEAENRRVLVFIVPSSPTAHCYKASAQESSKFYIRIGRETREARDSLLRELLVRKGQLQPWDRRPNPTATIADIDLIALRDSLSQMGLWDQRKSLEDYLSPADALSNFVSPLTGTNELDPTPRPRNYALLLFGSSPIKYFPGAYVIFSIYRGKDRSEATAERVEITGTLIEQTRKLIERLNTEAYTAFDKNSPSPNQVKYPIRALQEAVVNALVHRDYEIDQPTRVTVFSDRIEIVSPGALPRTIDIDKFRQGKASPLWRNQSLAYFFNKLQLAQAEGQGIPTILRLMHEEGCPVPTFDPEPERLICVLPAHPRHALMRDLNAIENKIIIGNHEDALNALDKLLTADPYNFRALELYCEVNGALGTPKRVYEFVVQRALDPKLLNSSTLLLLSETILQIKDDHKALSLARALNERALTGRMEESEVKRAVLNFRKMKQDDKAIEIVENVIAHTPALANNSSLRDLAAKARMDLAKKCMETGRDRSKSSPIRARAWELCRKYLDDADKDLKIALDYVTNEFDREYIQRDIEFLNYMKQLARKPDQRGRTRAGRHERVRTEERLAKKFTVKKR